MRNLSKIFIAFAAIAMSVCVWSCSKDEDDNSKSSNSNSGYCWEFLYQGSVVSTQCDLTESEADYVVSEMRRLGYSVTKRRK